ncbi:unnamed protein product [Protopolystoma xenopodis]|uniref:Uncharacterized protein n=1 Tax=Protopolystoma xenopodis TaxID=117903 RepID=A0A448WWV3_9PLAT|nr:unnamed protein product [Protopolystoma xenopodis]
MCGRMVRQKVSDRSEIRCELEKGFLGYLLGSIKTAMFINFREFCLPPAALGNTTGTCPSLADWIVTHSRALWL